MFRGISAFILLCALSIAAFAAQLCYPDPPRPAGNTGTGYYVAPDRLTGQWKLYTAAADEFRIRGVNRNHWDSYGTATGLPLSGANAERVLLKFSNTTTYNWGLVQTQMLEKGILPIPGNWDATCKTDAASLSAIVDVWVAQASTWTQLNGRGLVNIANEWGPAMSSADKGLSWRDGYITAIQRMRAAGYTMPLVVDAGACGQDAGTIVNYGQAVLDADPQHNVLFDVHVYGAFHYPATATWMQDYTKAMAALRATKLPLVIGEFGPLNVGPSQTQVPAATLVADAEAAGWGWMPWSWDDVNLSGCLANDSGFSMTVKCGIYTGASTDLTTWGQLMVSLLQQYRAR